MARILLIEDDEKFRKMLVLLLNSSGHEVVDTENGYQGTKTFRQSEFDLVITDVFMPEQDGLEVVQTISQQAKNTKIIVISGGGQRGTLRYLEYAKKFGADKTLIKPFENQELLNTINTLLED